VTSPTSQLLHLFLYLQASEFACLPGRSYRIRFPCSAAEACSSGGTCSSSSRSSCDCRKPELLRSADRRFRQDRRFPHVNAYARQNHSLISVFRSNKEPNGNGLLLHAGERRWVGAHEPSCTSNGKSPSRGGDRLGRWDLCNLPNSRGLHAFL